MRLRNRVCSVLAAFGAFGVSEVASAQVATDTLYASSVVINSAWNDESEAVGNPNCTSCNCNSATAPYAFLDDTNDRTWLEANLDNVDRNRIPDNYLVTSFRVDVMGRYNGGTVGEFEMQYFRPPSNEWFGPDGGTGVFNSPTFTSAADDCQYYRWGGGGVELLVVGSNEAVRLQDVDAMKVRVRRGAGATDCGSMRVRAFRVEITAERDLDGDLEVDSIDADDDGDGIADAEDCDPVDYQVWGRLAYPDPDGDGVRNSPNLVDTGVCFGATPPPGYTLNANGVDNCPTTANPDQSDCDGDGVGDACDPSGAPQITCLEGGGPVCSAGDTSFEVCATGGDLLSFQWYKVGRGALSDGAGAAGGEGLVSGSRTLRLGIAGLSVADAGQFYCVVTNSCGSATSESSTATLCPADFNCDGALDSDDVIGFFTLWDNGLRQADVNADGAVDSDDVVDFFGIWDNQGC